jgi:VWFA-related protein
LLGAAIWGAAAQVARPKITTTPRKSRGVAAGESRTPTIRSDVKLVLVPVTVTDAADRPIMDLSQSSFRILEDGVEQKIASFSRADGPVSMGLLFDSSGSMKNRIESSVAALRHLFQTTIPGDEFFLIQFSDEAELLGGFTSEPNEIHRRLGFVQANGWTSLLDAIALGAHKLKSAKNSRRVLVVLSDGNDNNSRFTESEIRNMVIEADVRIYAIGLSYRPRLLQRLADETGGKVLIARHLGELPQVVERLGTEIHSHYVLGYSPNNPVNDGKYRKLKVELLQPAGSPPLRTAWRRGYYSEGWVE